MPGKDKEATKTSIAVIEVQKRMPRARVVYCSATGVSNVRNMAYMTRLVRAPLQVHPVPPLMTCPVGTLHGAPLLCMLVRKELVFLSLYRLSIYAVALIMASTYACWQAS